MKVYLIIAKFLTAIIMALLLSPLATAVADDDLNMLTINPDRLQTFNGAGDDLYVDRDPFNWPPEQIARFKALHEERTKVDPFASLTLTGVMWDQAHPLAIINDKLIGINDTINGSTVTDITKETVVLKNGNLFHTLQFRAIAFELNPVKEDN